MEMKTKKVPLYMVRTGFALSAVLLINSFRLNIGEFNYYLHILSGFMLETALFIFIECALGAVIFEKMRSKKK